jgi:hypothetical protein
VPILGICYGCQLVAYTLGGKVESCEKSEYGKIEITQDTDSVLFRGVPSKSVVWMSHTDFVSQLPDGFRVTAKSDDCPCAAFEAPEKKVYAVGEKLPEYLKFVGVQDEIDDKEYENALMIVVDTATSDRISLNKMALAKEVIKIDHHIAKAKWEMSNLEIVDSSEISCASIIANIAFSLHYKLTSLAAKALFMGIVTDSGRFRYDGTNHTLLRQKRKSQ